MDDYFNLYTVKVILKIINSLQVFVILKTVLMLLLSLNSHADQMRVAVASNFVPTFQQLAVKFKQQSGHDLIISSGSTGQLYAQIKQDAPFDVYMAADMHRPEVLINDGLATGLTIYARGQLTLLANRTDCQSVFTHADIQFMAIANPDLAPYGLAAKQYLLNNQLWTQVSEQIVMGENVSQAMHMIVSKNATAGLVAQSLLVNHPITSDQCQKIIPSDEYEPINQAMVFLNRSKKMAVYNKFKTFLKSKQAIKLLKLNGYLVDEAL